LPAYFFDTSALVKRYVHEIGSTWVEAVTDPVTGNAIYIICVTEVEVTSAITRRQRGGTLSATDAATALAQFRQDLANEYNSIEVTPALLATAVALVETHGLRAYDAMQLAAATTLQAYRAPLALTNLIFVSADHDLNTAAVAEGLSVEDPHTHP
jgi:predicted nucleic acid-binding protein